MHWEAESLPAAFVDTHRPEMRYKVHCRAYEREERMAILKSVDGTVYNVPDDHLEKFELPEEVLTELAKQMDGEPVDGA